MSFPGGLLLGCDAGTLNSSKIKGSHTAMKSGMLGAETVFEAIRKESEGEDLTAFAEKFRNSWLYKELFDERNFSPAMHKYGTVIGGGIAFLEQNILHRSLPFTFHDTTPDYATLKPASECKNSSTLNRITASPSIGSRPPSCRTPTMKRTSPVT